MWPYLAATFELAFFAMIIALSLVVNAGIISAWFQNSWFDYFAMVIALIGVSMPIFWLRFNGAMGIFSIQLGGYRHRDEKKYGTLLRRLPTFT